MIGKCYVEERWLSHLSSFFSGFVSVFFRSGICRNVYFRGLYNIIKPKKKKHTPIANTRAHCILLCGWGTRAMKAMRAMAQAQATAQAVNTFGPFYFVRAMRPNTFFQTTCYVMYLLAPGFYAMGGNAGPYFICFSLNFGEKFQAQVLSGSIKKTKCQRPNYAHWPNTMATAFPIPNCFYFSFLLCIPTLSSKSFYDNFFSGTMT